MLTLHYFPGSCAFVPHVALEWSGLPYRTQVETRESIKTPAYLNMNPMGQVPLLEDGGWALTQNVAIIDYVNELAPQAGIFTHGAGICQRRLAPPVRLRLRPGAFCRWRGGATGAGGQRARSDFAAVRHR